MFITKKLMRASIASLALIAGLTSTTAMAAAPMAKTSAPGYFRMMLGEFEITALNDGTIDLPVDKLLAQPEEKTRNALADAYLKAPLETSVNAFLVNTGSKLVLIDAGTGSLFGPTLGKLIANLKASGYTPAQIDAIYLTHLHADHIGGLIAGNALAFPNATVHADKKDAEFWLNQKNLDKAPADQKDGYKNAMSSLNPYVTAKKFIPFKSNTKRIDGIESYATYGHTAGHTIYKIESQGEKLWVIGDLIHVNAVQLEHPEVTIAFDSDQKQAAVEREKIFTDGAKQGVLFAASHIQFPGIGHLRKDSKTYEWIPVNFTQIR